MKLKDAVLWLCVAGLLVTEVLLFRANGQRDAAQVKAREYQQKASQLQADLDQIRSSSVATLSTENARLRAENQGWTQKYPQLQTENRQLREQNQKLNQQLDAAHSAVQQQQQQLQQLQNESQAAETPSDSTAGTSASGSAGTSADSSGEATAGSPAAAAAMQNACINNLRQIDAAKQQWALENNRTASAVPTAQDLAPYLPDGLFPVCPAGGVYTINAVGLPPTCSVPGHTLSQ